MAIKQSCHWLNYPISGITRPGSELYSDDVDPDDTIGVDYDYWFNLDNGKFYQKIDGVWTLIFTFNLSVGDIYGSGWSGQLFVFGSVTLNSDVFIIVDSSSVDDEFLEITVPLGANNINRVYHIKWVNGDTRVKILPSGSDTIDYNNCYIIGELLDSRNLIGYQNGWFII